MQTAPRLPRLLRTLTVALLFLTAGCARDVRTRLQKSYPARIEGSTVLVYTPADTLPARAEVLGSARIRDFAPWTRYRYDNLVQRLKDETNKNGGNALLLTRYKPPTRYGSAGDRITADMLRLPDSVYTAAYFGNVALQNFYSEEYDKRDQKILSEASAFNHNKVHINFGWCFQQEEDRGLEFSLGYQRAWNTSPATQFIAGARYVKYFASFKSDGKDYRVRIDYIGPEVGGSLTVNERLIVPLVIGFGYLHYTDNYDKLSISNFGVHLDIGCEYRISYRVGVGVSYTFYAGSYRLPNVKSSTHTRSSVDGGLRFYF